MKVIIDEPAVADIDGLAAWIAKDSPKAARETVERILESIDRLAQFPTMGHPGRANGTLERGVSGTHYVIVYELHKRPTAIVVTAVFHTAQNE
jgi:toxin ParE1/3/4